MLAGLAAGNTAGAASVANLISVAPLSSSTLADAPAGPRGELLLAPDGALYGTSYAGGTTGGGTVLRIGADDVLTVVASLGTAAGGPAGPHAGVILANDGNFYGTSYLGGANGAGSVYRVTPGGTVTVVYSFNGAAQGGFLPYAGVMQAADGNLYGTTMRGGTRDAGIAFRLTLDGTLTKLHDFTGADGRNPQGRLVQAPDGTLWGTALTGGAGDRGVVFKVGTDGRVSTVYSFPPLGAFNTTGQGTNATGANPRGALTLGPDGNFYGATHQGGSGGFGTVFRVTPAGAVTVLHAFGGAPSDGGFPLGDVRFDAAGVLYGTTQRGGPGDVGTAWRIRPGQRLELLHGFLSGGFDGAQPYIALVPRGGFLYGASYTDSAAGTGAFFKLDQGTNGVLPIQFSVTPERITVGASATLSWSAPTMSSCTTSGAWNDTVTTAGTLGLTPPSPAIYNYALTCTDGAGVVRNAYATLVVNAPALQPVDGGGDGSGGGSFSLLGLALLGGTLAGVVRRRLR